MAEEENKSSKSEQKTDTSSDSKSDVSNESKADTTVNPPKFDVKTFTYKSKKKIV